MLHQPSLVPHVVGFCRSLRDQGLLVGPSETANALRSLGLVDIMERRQVYWAFRAILVSRAEEIAAFDLCFQEFWTFRLEQETSAAIPRGTRKLEKSSESSKARTESDESASDEPRPPKVQLVRTGASSTHVTTRRDLTVFQGDELAAIHEIAARLIRALPSRPGRRRRHHRRKGIPDLRNAFRLSLSHGGDLITIPRLRKILRIPRLLVLLDVSGSMDRHAELLLQLVYALGQRMGRVETFVFSTSLTRVTRELGSPSFSEALSRISSRVHHWSGGTRIGECLETLNLEHGRLLDRDTTVFLLSDGWETGEPQHMADQLATVRRQVRRLIWLNPLLGTADYEPLTLGLQAARPYVDTFTSALDLAHLKRLPRLVGR